MAAAFCQQNANYVTILAIYDEEDDASSGSQQDFASRFAVQGIPGPPSVVVTPTPSQGHPSNIFSSNADGDVVEITSLSEPPPNGLKVNSDAVHALQQLPSSSRSLSRSDYGSGSGSGGGSATRYEQRKPAAGRIYQPALKQGDRSPRVKHKVTMSPEVDRKFYPAECEEDSAESDTNDTQRMERGPARKSRITESLFEAQERLEENIVERTTKLIPPVAGAHPGQTVIVLQDSSINTPIGIEISPVHDPDNKTRLIAVEIRQIDDEGRIAIDGRIRVGDRLTEINQRPIYQMSISRARVYLNELQSSPHPTFTVDRPIESFQNTGGEISHRSQTSTSSAHRKPIKSALQQANTTAIGETSAVQVTKHDRGFGFTVTSRDTAHGERLFYIGSVKPDGAALGILKAGDRLLEMNGESTTGLRQNDVVNRLKKLVEGEPVKLLISRVGPSEEQKASTASLPSLKPSSSDAENDNSEHQTSKIEEPKKEEKGDEELSLDIALNDTGSAGLGISLKARAMMKPDDSRQDCGIFIKKVLHGGAAFKDGRLNVNDQLIGIEDIDLRSMQKNSDASDAITKCLKAIGPSATSVRLRIARSLEARTRASIVSMKTIGDSNDLSIYTNDKENLPSGAPITVPRTKVEGYGDYSEIVKSKPSQNGVTRRRASSTDEQSANLDETVSMASSQQRCVSEDEISHVDPDAFNRENPTRRSISEKRHMGASNDAAHTLVYQKIKEDRRTSAPVLSLLACGDNAVLRPSSRSCRNLRSSTSSSRMIRNRTLSASNRSSAPRCTFSLAADPNGMLRTSLNEMTLEDNTSATTNNIGMTADIEKTNATTNNNIAARKYASPVSKSLRLRKSKSGGEIKSPKRRSMSLESMGARKSHAIKMLKDPSGSQMMVDEVTGKSNPLSKKLLPSALKRVQRSKASNYSFRQALEQNLSTEEDLPVPGTADYEDITESIEPFVTLPRRTTAAVKEKQQRRKSVGSSLFSRLSQKLGGSRSRETSPEKTLSDAKDSDKKRLEQERKKIQDQYDRLKQKQQLQRVEMSPSGSYQPGIHPPPPYYAPHQNVSYDGYDQEGGNSKEGLLNEEGCVGGGGEDDMSEDEFIAVANSKFYSSMQRRKSKAKQLPSHDTVSTASRDTPDAQNIPYTPTTATGPVRVELTGSLHRRTTDKCEGTLEESMRQTATTTTHSTRGSRIAVQAGDCPPPPQASLVFIPDTDPSTRPPRRAPPRPPSTMRDSGRAPASCRRPPHEAATSSTTAAARPLPVVFPTSRTFFVGSSASSGTQRPSGSRSNSMRSRRKPSHHSDSPSSPHAVLSDVSQSPLTASPSRRSHRHKHHRHHHHHSHTSSPRQSSDSVCEQEDGVYTRSYSMTESRSKTSQRAHAQSRQAALKPESSPSQDPLSSIHRSHRMSGSSQSVHKSPSQDSPRPPVPRPRHLSVPVSQQPLPVAHHQLPPPDYQYRQQGHGGVPSESSRRASAIGRSNRASADASGMVTYVGVSNTTPVYLQTLLESPVGSPLPMRTIPIQRFHDDARPQRTVRDADSVRVHRHDVAVPHPPPDYDPAHAHRIEGCDQEDFDYRKLLRPVRRDRLCEQEHRITVISGDTAEDERLRRAHAARNGGVRLSSGACGRDTQLRRFF